MEDVIKQIYKEENVENETESLIKEMEEMREQIEMKEGLKL
jgi:hypothetical protein